MQRNGIIIRMRIFDPMETKFVRHVRDLVSIVRLLGDDVEWAFNFVVEVDRGPGVAGLYETTFEDLHDAMGRCVAVVLSVLI